MLVSVLEGHRIWAPHYDQYRNPLLDLEMRILPDILSPVSSRHLLDLACGTGRWMEYLSHRGACVFGADICGEMLAQAEKKQHSRGRSVIADIAQLPFPDNFADIVLCSLAAGYLPSIQSALAEMARAAKREGRVIISDLHPAGMSSGWTRSFRLGGNVYELENFSPSVAEICAAGDRAGLRLYMQSEFCFGEPERHYFREAGKEHLYRGLCGQPAIWVGVWKKA